MSGWAIAGLVVGSLVAGPAAVADDPTSAGLAVECDGQPATLVGTDDDDVLVGTAGPDVIVALAGDDVIRSRGGNDVICGGDGQDRLRGGAGDDRLFGQEDGQLGDILVGGGGSDYLDGYSELRDDRMKYRDEPAGITSTSRPGS
jgi:Ca2+-binding RTX toxin-like protein